jgi:hypothetical protein
MTCRNLCGRFLASAHGDLIMVSPCRGAPTRWTQAPAQQSSVDNLQCSRWFIGTVYTTVDAMVIVDMSAPCSVDSTVQDAAMIGECNHVTPRLQIKSRLPNRTRLSNLMSETTPARATRQRRMLQREADDGDPPTAKPRACSLA